MKKLLVLGIALAVVNALADAGDLRWKFKADGAIRSSPALGTNGWIIFGTLNGSVYAVDPATREMRWRTPLGSRVVSSACIREDGVVLIGAGDKLFALDAFTGTEQWQFAAVNRFGQPMGELLSTPSLGPDGSSYFTITSGTLFAASGQGALRWSSNFYTFAGLIAGYSSPVMGLDGTIFVGTTGSYQPSGGQILAFEAQTGRMLWQTNQWNWIQSSAAIGRDGTVFFSGTDKVVYALDPKTGTNKWTHLTFDSMTSSPVIGPDDILYVGANDGRLYALDAKTGAEKWHYNTFDSIHSTPAIAADGTIYFGSYDRNVYALDGKTGAKKWSFETGDFVLSSALIGADGTVFIGSHDGYLYALEGTAPLASGPWPMFKGNPRHTGLQQSNPFIRISRSEAVHDAVLIEVRAADQKQTIEYTDSLTSGLWKPAAADSGGVLTDEIRPSAPARFYRLRIK